MAAFYNEPDRYAAAWLRQLIAAGHLPLGVVDERDIRDIAPAELAGYEQCHFFAGIGVWPAALRAAGWPDSRPVWTGSCPCQPFSAAGGKRGLADERHLWPHWHWLIEQCRPAIVLGEQVASKDGLGWLDLVSADLEGTGYAVGAADMCAAGAGVDWQGTQGDQWLQRAIHDCGDTVVRGALSHFADWAGRNLAGDGGAHIRQRLYYFGVADAIAEKCKGHWHAGQAGRPEPANGGNAMRLADGDNAGPQGAIRQRQAGAQGQSGRYTGERRATDELCATEGGARRGSSMAGGLRTDAGSDNVGRRGPDWLLGRDGKFRPVEPESFPLVDAPAGRVGRLRAYGNALDFGTAKAFCTTVKELIDV